MWSLFRVFCTLLGSGLERFYEIEFSNRVTDDSEYPLTALAIHAVHTNISIPMSKHAMSPKMTFK